MVCVVAYGAVISLINHLLRVYGYDSKYITMVLVASTIYVYYKLWKWLCRRLDLIESKHENKQSKSDNKDYGI